MLKDGYYLSTYISISDINNILATCIRHDQNMSLWRKRGNNIELVHYWELERYTGEKHQYRSFYCVNQAKEIINQLLSEYHISINDIIEIWGTHEIDKENEKDIFCYKDPRFTFHSHAHLFSSLLFEKEIFDNEIILALEVDGGPDGEFDRGMYNRFLYMAAISYKGEIKGLEPIASPALLWLRAKNILGLEEGTLMALGSACRAVYDNKKVTFNEIYSYADYVRERKKLSDFICEIMHIDLDDEMVKEYDPNFSEHENRISMIVKKINDYSYDIMCKNIDKIRTKYGLDTTNTYLALSGGFALNCPINTKLVKKYGMRLLAPPCVNDTGISLGLALWKFYNDNAKFKFSLKNSYWGNKCTEQDIQKTVYGEEFKEFIGSVKKFSTKTVVEDIIQAPIVWVNGRAEIGPRALGARSILGDPRNIDTKNLLNRIKQRQWWRPVAPVVLEEKLDDWFNEAFESKYMLNAFKVKEDKAYIVPAICHLDGSSRVQTIKKEDNCYLYSVIEEFFERTNVPMLCNTSLNDKGEPIINTAKEAIHFALKKNIQVVYIDMYRIELINHHKYKKKGDYKRPYNINVMGREKDEVNRKIHTCLDVLTIDELHHYLCNQFLYKRYDLSNFSDILKLKRIIGTISKNMDNNI